MATTPRLGITLPTDTTNVTTQFFVDRYTEIDNGAETPAGAQAKANTAESNAKSYADSKFAAVTYPVTSVNSKTGAVSLTASDVGAETTSGAQTKANTAESNAKTYSDTQLTSHSSDFIKHPGYGITTGSANIYAVTLSPAPTGYVDGMAVSVRINIDSSAASTLNVNGLGAKGLKKANGTDITNLKANGVYTFRYNSSTGNFIVQGEGASGNALASDLLSGKTASTDAGDITGTMVNNGAVTITPSASSQSIPAGYHNGSGTVPAVTVPAANVLTGTTIAGTAGTMPNNGAVTITPGTTNQTIAAGYHNGSGVVNGDADLIASNIKSGVNIFGVVGTVDIASLGGKRYATGTAVATSFNSAFTYINGTTVNQFSITVSGLTFKPSLIYAFVNQSGVTAIAVYSEYANDVYPKAVKVTNGGFNSSNFTSTVAQHIKGDVAPASITSTGFTIPVSQTNQTYTWIAIE